MQILRQILAGLAHIHSQGIIHSKALCQLGKGRRSTRGIVNSYPATEPSHTL